MSKYEEAFNFYELSDDVVKLNKDNSYTEFIVEFYEKHTHSVSYAVYEVTSWSVENIPEDIDLLFTGNLRWDGCSNINQDEDIVHWCGPEYWSKYCEALENLYKEASSRIQEFDEDYLWENKDA